MKLLDLLQLCSLGVEAYTLFMGVAHNTLLFGDIDEELLAHVKQCKGCKVILRETIGMHKKNLAHDSERLENVLHEFDKLIHIFCTLEEIYGEFWDEERYGSLEKAQKRLEELRKIKIPSYKKLLERIEYRRQNPFPIELQEEIAKSLHKKTGIPLEELRTYLEEINR